MSAELKREILRLLREDEEFRYAVAGYLGLQDIRTTLAQLAEAVKTLIDAVNALNSRVESLEEGLKEVKAGVSSLNERVGKLEANVSSLNERVGRLEADVSSLNKRMEKVEADVSSLDKRMGRVERELRSMRRTLENLTMSEEEEANLVVTHLLRERGISIETGPAAFDKKYEFDIYGTTGQLTVVGDAKVRAGPRAVRKLVERVEEAKRRWPEKLPGRVVAVLYCLRAAPGTAEEAEKLGVWLLESMREKTKPPL
jgi:chromosome segregation ATPase